MNLRHVVIPTALASLTLLAGCNTDPGLTAIGTVEVVADGTTRRFDLPAETRLDAPEGTSGRFTGECALLRSLDAEGEEQWGINVVIRSGGTSPIDDFPLRSVSVIQQSNAAPVGGQVDVELGERQLSGSGAVCFVNVPYVNGQDGVVGLSGGCDVADASGTARVSLELDLAGCDSEL